MRCLNSVLEDLFYRYAGLIHRYVYIFLIVPVVVTGLLGGGYYFQERQTLNNSQFLFLPTDGYGKYEKQTFSERFPFDPENFVPGQNFEAKHYYIVIVTGNGTKNENLFQEKILRKISELNRYILNDHTILGYDSPRRNLTYKDLCLTSQSECFDNGHVSTLLFALNDDSTSMVLRVRYPITRVSGTNDAFYLGAVLGCVETYDNATIKSIKAVRLVYFNKHQPTNYYYYGVQFRESLTEYLLNYTSDLIKISFAHEEAINSGLGENAKRFKPEVGVTVVLVMMFSYLSSFILLRTKEGLYIDWVRSKPLLAVFGTIEPGLAIVSTIGLLLLIGCPYNEIVIVMPFLVFAIGVDDMFIMMSSWHNTDINDPPEKRFRESLSEAGVAITITSVTDIIAFAVGSWNPLPSIQLYCYYTAVAMFFELLYQCTFYAAAVSLLGRAESKSLHCMTWRKAKTVHEAKTKWQKRFCLGALVGKTSNMLLVSSSSTSNGHCTENGAKKLSQDNDTQAANIRFVEKFENEDLEPSEKLTFAQRFFRNFYGPLLLKPAMKISVVLFFALYLAAAIRGCMIMPSGLTPERLVPEDHYVHHYLKDESLWQDGIPLCILINRPFNFTENQEKLKFHNFVNRLESTSHSLGSNYTMLWMNEYEYWYENKANLNIYSNSSEFDGLLVKKWLNSLYYSKPYWSSCIQWRNETDEIEAFRFSIGLKNFAVPADHQDAIVIFRQILSEYPEYNATCFQAPNEYVDQYIIVYSITVRNTMVALAIMVFIAMMLIPHPVCGFFVIICVLSIDVGVSGFLSWWNVSMDIISMIGMIMATGFAVDFSAHVSYAFVRASGTANQRAIKALETLGWPVFQGVTATLLGVLVMGTVDAYMFQVFFKTVVLVILFGCLHSIVFLPVALTMFIPEQLSNNKCIAKFSSKEEEDGNSRGQTPISELTTLQSSSNNVVDNGV